MRESLLAAASAAFGARGYAGVSLRDVAKAAGTTAAMVHYYFDDKDGLYAALLERALLALLTRVRGALEQRAASPGVPAASVDVFLDAAIEALGSEPWIPQLILREVLSEEAPFRERFIERYARPMTGLLRSALREEIAGGRLRGDLDPELALMSFLGMTAFPFLARPVLERALGVSYDASFRARMAAHTKRLFLEGSET